MPDKKQTRKVSNAGEEEATNISIRVRRTEKSTGRPEKKSSQTHQYYPTSPPPPVRQKRQPIAKEQRDRNAVKSTDRGQLVRLGCIAKEQHPHFMRSMPRQVPSICRLEPPRNEQKGDVTLLLKARRYWAHLRVVPSLEVTPSVVRHIFSNRTEHSRLTLINSQPIQQTARFMATESAKVEYDHWRCEEYGIRVFTTEHMPAPPLPKKAKSGHIEWETIFYTLSLGKHVAIEQRLRTPRVEKAKLVKTKKRQATKLTQAEYRREELPLKIIQLRAFKSYPIGLSTVEDLSNQHKVYYMGLSGSPEKRSTPSHKAKQADLPRPQGKLPVEHTKNIPRPQRVDRDSEAVYDPAWSDKGQHRRSLYEQQDQYKKTPDDLSRSHVQSPIRKKPLPEPKNDDYTSVCISSSVKKDYPAKSASRKVSKKVKRSSPTKYRPTKSLSKHSRCRPKTPISPDPNYHLKIEKVEIRPNKGKPVTLRPKQASKDSARKKHHHKSHRPKRYHVDLMLDYDANKAQTVGGNAQLAYEKPKDKNHGSETNVSLGRHPSVSEKKAQKLSKSLKKPVEEVKTAKEVRSPTKALRLPAPKSPPRNSKDSVGTAEKIPDGKTHDKHGHHSDSPRTAKTLFFAKASGGSPIPKKTDSGYHLLYQVAEGDAYKYPKKSTSVKNTKKPEPPIQPNGTETGASTQTGDSRPPSKYSQLKASKQKYPTRAKGKKVTEKQSSKKANNAKPKKIEDAKSNKDNVSKPKKGKAPQKASRKKFNFSKMLR